MHINDFLALGYTPFMIRTWFIERAMDTAAPGTIDPVRVSLIMADDLVPAWEVAWEIDFKGNEAAACESLQRFKDGKSRRYLVTANSGKFEGMAMVVTDVEDKAAAFHKAAQIVSEMLREPWLHVVLSTSQNNDIDLLLPEDYDEDDIRETYEDVGPRRCWDLSADQLVYNQNLPGAICW
jgi:hypothetical protein